MGPEEFPLVLGFGSILYRILLEIFEENLKIVFQVFNYKEKEFIKSEAEAEDIAAAARRQQEISRCPPWSRRHLALASGRPQLARKVTSRPDRSSREK